VVHDFTGIGDSEPDAQALAESLVAGKNSQYEKVMAINDHFSPDNGFEYTLETDAGTSGSALTDFLNAKKGYCQQYAAATAYLIRAAGIPARVAIGFDRGVQKSGYVSVTNQNAHAWVEVYFAGHGWVPFDTTPPGGQGRSAGGLSWADSEDDEVTTPAPGASTAPTPSATPGATRPEDIDNDPDSALDVNPQDAAPTPIDLPAWSALFLGAGAAVIDGLHWPKLAVWAKVLLGLALVLIIASVPALVRAQARRRRMAGARSANAAVAAHAAWDELIDMLTDLGLPAEESETPRATARRLAATGLDSAERHAVELLAAEEERARYAPPALVAAANRRGGRVSGRATVTGASGRATVGEPIGAAMDGASGRATVDAVGFGVPAGTSRRAESSAAQRAEATQRILAVHVVWRALAERAGRRVRLRALLLPPSLVASTNATVTRAMEDTSIAAREWSGTVRSKFVPRGPRTHP